MLSSISATADERGPFTPPSRGRFGHHGVRCSPPSAAKGDWRRAKLVVDMQQQDIERRTDAAPPETADFGEADKEVIKQLKARLFRKKGGSDD